MKILKMFFYYQFYFLAYIVKVESHKAVTHTSVLLLPINFTILHFLTCSVNTSLFATIVISIINLVILAIIESLHRINKEKIFEKIENSDKLVLKKSKQLFYIFLTFFGISFIFSMLIIFNDFSFCLFG